MYLHGSAHSPPQPFSSPVEASRPLLLLAATTQWLVRSADFGAGEGTRRTAPTLHTPFSFPLFSTSAPSCSCSRLCMLHVRARVLKSAAMCVGVCVLLGAEWESVLEKSMHVKARPLHNNHLFALSKFAEVRVACPLPRVEGLVWAVW